MANALETDATQLLKMCLEEYQPLTWKAIAPFMEFALSQDEFRLLTALRASAGGPIVSALGETSRQHLEDFIASVRVPPTVIQNEMRHES